MWPRRPPLSALLALVVTAPWAAMVAGQGLSDTQEQMAANAVSTATAFDAFESALGLASSGTGGRSRAGRGGTAAGVSEVRDTLKQIVESTYHIAASPKAFPTCQHLRANPPRPEDDIPPAPPVSDPPRRTSACNNFVPPAVDQGPCSTCVAQAIASTIQISTATSTQQDVSDWQVNAPSLYYCSAGGRGCKTGWDIKAALGALLNDAKKPGGTTTLSLVRPNQCIRDAAKNDKPLRLDPLLDPSLEPDVRRWNGGKGPCVPAARAASRTCNRDFSSTDGTWVTCRFQSLDSFWDIQRTVRNQGAVITRINIPDDLDNQFNLNATKFTGEVVLPYRFNTSATSLFAHAVTIVGYSNDQLSWTLLNSWGNSARRPGERGVTSDGLFKVYMGLLGVGTPDQTFSIDCRPSDGTQAYKDLPAQPWLMPRKRLLRLDADNQRAVGSDGEKGCHTYQAQQGELLDDLMERFNQDHRISAFMVDNLLDQEQDNPGGRLFRRQPMSYKFGVKLNNLQLQEVMKYADESLWLCGESTIGGKEARCATTRPYLTCFSYDPSGIETPIRCENGRANIDKCLEDAGRNGTVPCALNWMGVGYDTPRLPASITLRVCGDVTPTQEARERTDIDLPPVLEQDKRTAIDIVSRVLQQAPPGFSPDDARRCSGTILSDPCNPSDVGLVSTECEGNRITKFVLNSKFIPSSPKECRSTPVRARSAEAAAAAAPAALPAARARNGTYTPEFTVGLLRSLQNLTTLKSLTVIGFRGLPTPSYYGPGTCELESLTLRYACANTEVYGSSSLPLEQWLAAWSNLTEVTVTPRNASILDGFECTGISGSLGELPEGSAAKLKELRLARNAIGGSLPATWPAAMPNLQLLDLSGNALSGDIPLEWTQAPWCKNVTLSGNSGQLDNAVRGSITNCNVTKSGPYHSALDGLLDASGDGDGLP